MGRLRGGISGGGRGRAVRGGGVAVQIAEVRRGGIDAFIDERGTTRVPRVYRITTPQAGRIEEITLAAGSVVQRGQIVARIVEEDLENEVAEARAAVERLDAAIVENDNVAVERSLALQAAQFVASMNNTVEAAKAQMEVSGKRSEFAETNLGRARNSAAPPPPAKKIWTAPHSTTGKDSSGSGKTR